MSKRVNIVGIEIDQLNEEDAINWLIKLSDRSERGYVCFVNAHSVVTAQTDNNLKIALTESTLNCPDGVSVSKLMNVLGAKSQKRVGGPDFMLHLCSSVQAVNKKVFLYGNTQDTLDEVRRRILNDYPDLDIVGAISPPFRELTDAEINDDISIINSSGADFLFVSLGCPKQEIWMNKNYLKIHAISLGFGAAFDFYSGKINRAPAWMRESGLEWFHRLISDPRRLWKRYLVTNTLYLLYAAKLLIRKKLFNK